MGELLAGRGEKLPGALGVGRAGCMEIVLDDEGTCHIFAIQDSKSAASKDLVNRSMPGERSGVLFSVEVSLLRQLKQSAARDCWGLSVGLWDRQISQKACIEVAGREMRLAGRLERTNRHIRGVPDALLGLQVTATPPLTRQVGERGRIRPRSPLKMSRGAFYRAQDITYSTIAA